MGFEVEVKEEKKRWVRADEGRVNPR